MGQKLTNLTEQNDNHDDDDKHDDRQLGQQSPEVAPALQASEPGSQDHLVLGLGHFECSRLVCAGQLPRQFVNLSVARLTPESFQERQKRAPTSTHSLVGRRRRLPEFSDDHRSSDHRLQLELEHGDGEDGRRRQQQRQL